MPKGNSPAVDQELLEDMRHLQQHFGLKMLAPDYTMSLGGNKHLLEVNHIPTRGSRWTLAALAASDRAA